MAYTKKHRASMADTEKQYAKALCRPNGPKKKKNLLQGKNQALA
jgi:hypothetical protein